MRKPTASAGNLLVFLLHFERNRVRHMVDGVIPAHLVLHDALEFLERVEAFLVARDAANPTLGIPQGIPVDFLELIGACETAVALHDRQGRIAFERIEAAYLSLKHHIVFMMQLGLFDPLPA